MLNGIAESIKIRPVNGLVSFWSNEGSGESVQMHRLGRAFATCIVEVWMKMRIQTNIYPRMTRQHGRFNEAFVFFLFDSLRPINNLSVIKGRVFLGRTSTKLGYMFLLKDTTQ